MSNKRFANDGTADRSKVHKINILIIGISVLFILYIIRLFTMQIVEGKQYQNQSVRISRTYTTIAAQRGYIYDRNVTFPMVNNNDSFAVDVTPGEIPAKYYDTVIAKLASYLGIKKSQIDRKIKNKVSYQPVEIKTNVTFEIISNIAENVTDLPGVSWRNKPVRNYVETGSICHVLGYVGDITQEELKILYNQGYNRNSVIGKAGIEKQYDQLLQGTPGREIHAREANGRVLNTAAEIIPPKMGKNLVLTIDSATQLLAEKALGERVGAIVVLKPATGEILAMVSYPYFNSNIFSQDNASAEYQKLIKSENFPLLNRAVNAVYPPASTFKTIMTTAILDQKAIPADKKIDCPGIITYGDREFKCHIYQSAYHGHGPLDLKNALAQSCDIYYWVAGRDYLGVDVIATYAREFGLGENTNIDLPSQSEGFVPTAQWKERVQHKKWLGGDTMNMSIGQGYTTVTPLHIANMIAMVANGGKIYKPHLLKEVRDPATDEIIQTIQPEVMLESSVSPDVWKEVQQDLRYMITNGTATYPMGNKTIQMAGKTGTAEVNGYAKGHWHSWMVAYAPFDAPVEDQIVVATLVEAVNKWEWWAPYATNIVINGYFNDLDYDQSIDQLGFRWMVNRAVGGQE
jgi:penicillin-binding protein 2